MTSPVIYVVSDSVGETAELVTKAAASQFQHSNVSIRRFPFIESPDHIEEVISLAKLNQAIIAYTLVRPVDREYMKKRTHEEGIFAYDIIGPLMDELENKY